MSDDLSVWVCEDCYIAHHFGFFPCGPSSECGGTQHNCKPGVIMWHIGEGDTVSDREPLTLLDGYEIYDGTCSNHYDGQDPDDDECKICGRGAEEDGVQSFTWSSCEGCGSHLGGGRSLLTLREVNG